MFKLKFGAQSLPFMLTMLFETLSFAYSVTAHLTHKWMQWEQVFSNYWERILSNIPLKYNIAKEKILFRSIVQYFLMFPYKIGGMT